MEIRTAILYARGFCFGFIEAKRVFAALLAAGVPTDTSYTAARRLEGMLTLCDAHGNSGEMGRLYMDAVLCAAGKQQAHYNREKLTPAEEAYARFLDVR